MKLIIDNLSFANGTEPVFSYIQASFKEQQLVCVLGPNGVGKSTLFKCILNSLQPLTGAIKLDGVDIRQVTEKELAQKIAYIPQVHIPTFDYQVLDIVVMGKTPFLSNFYQSPSKNDEQQAYQYLEALGIEKLALRNYSKISGGERQLVLIARALMQQAKVIIMDEPTASLDFGHQIQVYRKIEELVAQGYLILVSTHQPEHALTYANTVLVLENETTYHLGKPLEIITEKLLFDMYQEHVLIEKIGKGAHAYYACVPV